MQPYISIILLIAGYAGLYLLIRKDVDEEKKMTKRGFVKLLGGMAVIFVVTVLFVTIMEN
ncbi:DUF3976 domain-containing protein [Lentibacillus sediminis]|uniref:DUF3976 domain-containing protein n=1 Tax=Lentibacillus sediminis TaxID=1940529 RepID=UPI000C1C3454|nr:DUF3976 domain-containing protein [Lentibacillus sediminis]